MSDVSFTTEEIHTLCGLLHERLYDADAEPTLIVGIPRGGTFVARDLAGFLPNADVCTPDELPDVYDRHQPILLVDDIVVTGTTIQRMAEKMQALYSGTLYTAALVAKGGAHRLVSFTATDKHIDLDNWVTFPWEVNDEDAGRPEDAVRRLIEYAGFDPSVPSLQDTPRRVLAFYDEMRKAREAEINMTQFEEAYQDLVLVTDVPLFSMCEHHMMPFHGVAHVAYLPEDIAPTKDKVRVLGLSKLARIVTRHASGLTVQERLSHEIADAIKEATKADTVAVIIEATHTCMSMRGARAHSAKTTTSAMLGRFREDATLRGELLALVKG